MKKKSILVVDPFEKMSKILIEELNNLGYNAIPLFKGKMKSFDYSSCSKFDKLKNIFHRIILKNNNYYMILLENFYQKYTEDLVDKIIKEKINVDYVLVFRPHGFSTKFYKLLNKLTSNISLYEYDGLEDIRVSALKKNLKYVKRIFLFDFNDLAKIPTSKFITNYHYNLQDNNEQNKIDFYYLGIEGNNRIEKLQNFIYRTREFNKKIIVQVSSDQTVEAEEVQFITQSIDYKDYLNNIRDAKAIIDIKAAKHNGLSFRFFEALNLKKKIITDNHSIKNYNFYHPDNIFITDFETFDGLEEFMQKPYHTVHEDIIKMYSLENWIKNIFDIDDYIAIPLPKKDIVS